MITAAKLHPKLEQLVRESAAMGASDLYLVPGEPLTVRTGGQIQRTDGEVLTAAEISEMAAVALGADQLATIGTSIFELHRSVLLTGEMMVQLSVSLSCGQHTIWIQLCGPEIASVELLRVPEAILKAALSPSGLVIFAGLNGSGRSSTAYSVVDYINANRACRISTAENPVYMRFTPKKAIVQQREIGLDIPDLSFAALPEMIRDVDVFFMSEIMTLPDVNACVVTAETGHLVLTVLRVAPKPQQVIRRIIDVFPEDVRRLIAEQLAGSLSAICCQTLLPCSRGGRVAAYAVLVPDAEMRRAIAEGKDLTLRQSPMPPECQTMQEAIQSLLDQGDITAETARRALEEIG